jgi:hypothetical protein
MLCLHSSRNVQAHVFAHVYDNERVARVLLVCHHLMGEARLASLLPAMAWGAGWPARYALTSSALLFSSGWCWMAARQTTPGLARTALCAPAAFACMALLPLAVDARTDALSVLPTAGLLSFHAFKASFVDELKCSEQHLAPCHPCWTSLGPQHTAHMQVLALCIGRGALAHPALQELRLFVAAACVPAIPDAGVQLYCTALHCTALYCAVLYCAVLHFASLHGVLVARGAGWVHA